MPFTSTNRRFFGGTVSNIKWYLVRRWLYWVVAAGIPLAIYAGWLDPEVAPLVLPIILAAFNTRPPVVPGEEAGE